MSNCNFADNSAYQGGAIYSLMWYTTADTCIFKTNSGDNVNVVIFPPTLDVDNFTTFYGSGENLTFDLKTNSSIPVNNGSISISVYFKNNDSWVDSYTCLSGEGWIPNLEVGSYYAIFNTSYAEFKPINRTIKIIPNISYYINITSIETNNKKVNVTAKSNIPQDILEGKLLFIVPNTNPINATYAGNGIWWAVHTFNDYGEYQINATYAGLDNVTVNAATIIIKTPTEITVKNATVDLFVNDVIGSGATLSPADAGNLTYISSNSSVAQVVNGKIIAVGRGTANITVSFTGNKHYQAAVNKTIIVNVIKCESKVTILSIDNAVYPNNAVIRYSIENRTNVKVIIDGVSSDKIIITNDTITVIGLDAGNYTITILNNESSQYHKSNDTAYFTVNKATSNITSTDISKTYGVDSDLEFTLNDSNGNPISGVNTTISINGVDYTCPTDENGVARLPIRLDPKTYTATLAFAGNDNYEKMNATVHVTVKKATPILTAKKKTFKAKTKTKKYKITLKTNKNAPMSKDKVILKIKGKKYTAKTNSKGKATFKIKKLTKKGKYKAKVTFKGNYIYNKVAKKVKITVK